MQIFKKILTSVIILASTANILAADYWDGKVSLFEILPINKNDIVFLGNSITDGGEWAELFNDPRCKNRGISADVINGVRKRLHQVTDGEPAKIFLLIGVNDVSHNKTVDQMASEYEQLVKDIKNQTPHTKLYLQAVMPYNQTFGKYKGLVGKDNTIKQLNERIKKIAAKYNATYIDTWTPLADKNGRLDKRYTYDGLHLSGAGYLAWITKIRPYVEE